MSSSDWGALRAAFDEHGFAVVRGFLDAETLRLVLAELDRMVAELRKKEPICAPAFRALGDAKAFADLRRSAGTAALFGAPGVVDTVGHGLHFLPDTATCAVALSPLVERVARDVGGMEDPRVVQTKFVMKPAKAGARVPCHSDAQYIYTDPPSGVALWIALDAADASNGCVEVAPGSHRAFAVGQRFAVGEPGGPAVWREPPPAAAPGAQPFPGPKAQQDALPWEAVPARPGDCVLFHYALLHRSAPNTSSAPRRALTLHLVDGACRFAAENWIPAPEAGFPRPGAGGVAGVS